VIQTLLTPHRQIKNLVDSLPRVTEKQLVEGGEKGTQSAELVTVDLSFLCEDSFCPICFTPYLAILAEEETASAMDSPAHPTEHLGVTKLSQSWQCGHIFCRREYVRHALFPQPHN